MVAPKKMTKDEKIAAYERALNEIAAWEDGDRMGSRDEPHASEKARNVLKRTGAAK